MHIGNGREELQRNYDQSAMELYHLSRQYSGGYLSPVTKHEMRFKKAKRSIRNAATKIAQTSQPTKYMRVQGSASQFEERTQPARKIGVKKGKKSGKRRAASSYTVVKPCPRRRNRTGYNRLSTPSCELNITKFSCRRPRGDNSRPATIDTGQRRRPDTNEKPNGRPRETNAK